MFLSVFDLFKIGLGPSSSHTVGPMVAARRFLGTLNHSQGRIHVTLHGSLAFTGKGHGTDRAVILGLAGETPQTIDPSQVEDILKSVVVRKTVGPFAFDPLQDIVFDYGPALKGHANGLVFRLLQGTEVVATKTYFSIGGGFVQTAAEREAA
jgi:L-serine dehydratase